MARYTWRSRLPYTLEFDVRTTRVDRPFLVEGTAQGELAGVGRWRLFEGGGATAVTYEWLVDTTARWMNVLAPLARPVFAWNHDLVMRNGGEGLAARLGVPLPAQGRPPRREHRCRFPACLPHRAAHPSTWRRRHPRAVARHPARGRGGGRR